LKDKHLKMTLEASGTVFDAIAFNVDVERWPDPAVSEGGVVYTLDINEYRGERRLQLLVSSLWPCSS
jgi:single-stranded-DNA-specific exonuclease